MNPQLKTGAAYWQLPFLVISPFGLKQAKKSVQSEKFVI
ncbi:hypothetical protein Hsw_0089 [Hymenobacter swuensis DY53]|uniref:Uncharacterized protein n=1 Tax=Hymenobacter swuensis DY53 TaxID=1227739 RepID=W8ERB7_9BACT|nr:hypothetical protein Hsw_0089 [Hymenobacter swuensis DY53]